MRKLIFAFDVALILLSELTFAQTDRGIEINPEGKLIKTYPYSFPTLDTSKYLLTFNDKPVYIYGTKYTLVGERNGLLKAYSKNGKDTSLISTKPLKFINPTFVVEIAGYRAGDTLVGKEMLRRSYSVSVPNNDISLTFKVYKAYIVFATNGKLKRIKIDNKNLSQEVIDEIIRASSEFMILDLWIELPDEKVHLPPAVFYLK